MTSEEGELPDVSCNHHSLTFSNDVGMCVILYWGNYKV